MKAREITEAGKEALLSGRYDMVRVNYANPDMVGHTGDLEASIKACEVSGGCGDGGGWGIGVRLW